MGKSLWKAEVMERDDNECKVCGTKRNLTVHHKVPVCRGGKGCLENCVCWCRYCHRVYHNQWGVTVSDDFGNPVEQYYHYCSPKKRKHRRKHCKHHRH
jgi:hypothetical protein